MPYQARCAWRGVLDRQQHRAAPLATESRPWPKRHRANARGAARPTDWIGREQSDRRPSRRPSSAARPPAWSFGRSGRQSGQRVPTRLDERGRRGRRLPATRASRMPRSDVGRTGGGRPALPPWRRI
jgi:hypothetical protein